ncbi:hypothetical protein FHW88_005174 [Mucilaginibacter sp. SG538B]|uniref:hypothetical protein n=1 Tax=Mucilaginibacter sp. SG538B TaxID=2587021 RepID=UPI00159E086F|nr:hypothetical protein [Mucilaginibacter sp. SG538B]NVM66856.1 hypothetical protein [Mucilaginibacter sp. SG538B]
MEETKEMTTTRTTAKREAAEVPCGNARTGKVTSLHMARRIAMDWHGGQWSALYALGSSGLLPEGQRNKCLVEVTNCLKGEVLSLCQARQLRLLQTFIVIRYGGDITTLI